MSFEGAGRRSGRGKRISERRKGEGKRRGGEAAGEATGRREELDGALPAVRSPTVCPIVRIRPNREEEAKNSMSVCRRVGVVALVGGN